MKSNKGFSLVELMVVVAIIGVLAMIGIPSINKYMAKARQSEAKTNLSSLYTANKAFFAEYNTYDNRFQIIGFLPEGKLRYNVGWSASSGFNLASYGYTAAIPATTHFNSSTYCPASGTCQSLADANPTITGASITNTTFVAVASGRIGGAGGAFDTWTIDHNKNLTNTIDGTQ
ncbi:MAG: prepilin-type N-terminal cleavage/methylation domain-containing protein [Bdellovibrionaceae bacterium]|nr:prepilin-type N-terminal cleavage/methylation domain-containing protein [Pseudobdellovibrionaceae bacterium]